MPSNRFSSWDFVGSVVLLVHRPGKMHEAEFDVFMDQLRKRWDLKGLLIKPNGSIPTPSQRTQIHQWIERRQPHVAVVSDAMLVRGVVTAFGWFGLSIRAFRENEVEPALGFAGMAHEHYARATRVLDSLQAGLLEEDRPAAM